MTVERASIVAVAAFLALSASGVDARAQEAGFAFTCVGTETGGAIHFSTRWGSDGDWNQWTAEPGEWVSLAWSYDEPGQNSSPQLQIRFDADMTDGDDWAVLDLKSYAASGEDCEQEGMTYDFYLDGETLVLVGEDETAPAEQAAASSPGGAFGLTFVPPQDENAALVHEILVAAGTIEEDVQLLNEMLALPVPVSITFLHSGQGSFYDPETNEIQIDYQELLDEWELFIATRSDAPVEELAQLVVDDAEFALFHEVGHALIKLLELPVLGKQEDAVDSLATVLTLDILEDPQAALTGAEMWRLRAEHGGPLDVDQIVQGHSFDIQRYATLKCLIYGSDPEGLAHIAEEGEFDEERTWRCQEDYQHALNGWETVLEPHTR